MLDPSVLTELEELILCGNCKQKYNDNEQCPKYLSCKHYFCLRCIENNFIKGRELLCAHCWKKTELNEQGADGLQTNLPLLALANNFSCLKITNNKTNFIKSTDKERKSENCLTHGMPLALWCATCCTQLCRACATPQDHPGHQVRTVLDAKEQLISDVQVELATMGKLSSEIQRLAVQQREFLIKILEACVTLKTHVETDLQNGWSHLPEIQDARETLGKAKANLQIIDNPSDVMSLYSQLLIEKHRLQSKYHEMMLQCQLDDLIGNSGVLFNFDLLKQAVAGVQNGDTTILPQLHQQNGRLNNLSTNPILFLANYCMSQLYSRHVISKQSTTTTVNNISQQNGTIDYHHQQQHQVPTAPPQSNGTIHLNSIALSQHQFQPTSPNQQQQLILLPPNSPSIKSSSLTSINSLLQQQQQQQHNSYLQDSSSSGSSSNTGGGLLVGINSPTTTINNNNILLRGPGNNIYPMYYFNIDVNGSSYGRIVIEVRPDVAPKMSQNFSVLSSGDIGIGYKGCAIFQCWEGESIITGDFELNNGRGGRSIFDDGYFMPDDTKFPAVRGAVGMRRTQKRHDNMGMVGSQFRIILQEMRGFTGIFGHVVEGLELVEKLSTYGDQTGKPTKNILITQCGKL